MGEEKQVNYTAETVKGLIKEFNLEPFGYTVVITLNKEEVDGDLVLSDNVISERQYVIATSQHASKDLTPGDEVVLNIEKLMVSVPSQTDMYQSNQQVKIEPIEFGGEMFGIVEVSKLKAKVTS